MNAPSLIIRHLGRVDYHPTWRAMRERIDLPNPWTHDEIWFLEHPPVFTLGQAGRRAHVHEPGTIPVVASDRGGQVTYHGPGQLVAYLLLDLKQRRLGVKRLVHALEQAIIDMLAAAEISAERRAGAPGVYVHGSKIAAIGLRIRDGRSYHGLALNVDGDLAPFHRIDPCGYPNLPVTRIKDLGLDWTLDETARRLLDCLVAQLGYPPEAVRAAADPGLPDEDVGSGRRTGGGLAGAGG